jgi:Ca-activated chloride channel family protein
MDRTRIIFTAIVGVALLLACGILASEIIGPRTTPTPTPTINVTATSTKTTPSGEAVLISFWTNDTKAEWVEEVTTRFNASGQTIASGRPIFVEFNQSDSGDVLPMLHRGEIEPTLWSPGESSWVNDANVVWQDLHRRPLTSGECPEVVYTAIGIGMFQPMAEAMGWPEEGIGWEEITALATDPEGWSRYGHPEWGQFKFGHTHPDTSNTGLLAMGTLAYSAAGLTDGLTPEVVKSEEVVDAFRQLELNTHRYGMSTKGLSIKMAERGPGYLHAISSSEISVLATDFYQKDLLRFPLVFIFPKGGTFWSNNPVCILDADWVGPEEQEAAEIYRDYLLGSEAQGLATEEWLRPVDFDAVPQELREEWQYTDISITRDGVPSVSSLSGETVAAVVDVFVETKKRVTVVLVLDTSNSMAQSNKLGRAMDGAIDFLDFLHRDDRVIGRIFNDTIIELQPAGRVGQVAESLAGVLFGIFAEGNTALYDAVCGAVDTIETQRVADEAAGERRLYGIVLLSDGKDTNSTRTQSDMFQCVPDSEDSEGVKIFTIAYGDDADVDLLTRLANRSNGLAYTSDPENIDDVFLRISFEQ